MLFLHWVGNRFLSLVTNVLYNTTLSDMETCYKLFDRTVLDGITLRASASSSSPRSRPRSCGRASASTRCRSRTPAASSTKGKKITWRDGFVALWTLVKYRFVRLSSVACRTRRRRATRRGPRWSSTTRRGRCCSRACARCSPTRAPATPEVVVVDNGSRRRLGRRGARGAPRACAVVDAGRATSGTRPPPTAGTAATDRARRRGRATPTSRCRPGTRGGDAGALRAPSPTSPRSGPRCATPTGRGTRRPARTCRRSTRSATRCSDGSWPRNRFTRRYRQLDADWDPAPRRRLGVGRGAVPAPRRGRLGRRLGRALLHVHGGRRPVLAAAPARVAGRATSPAARRVHVQGASTAGRPYRMIVEHHRSAYRFAARRWHGARGACCSSRWPRSSPSARCVDMAARALRTRPETPRVSG